MDDQFRWQYHMGLNDLVTVVVEAEQLATLWKLMVLRESEEA